jgi:hypothetical protein
MGTEPNDTSMLPAPIGPEESLSACRLWRTARPIPA